MTRARGSRWLATLLAAMLLVPAGAAAKHGRSLLVVGDSLAVGTRPYIGHFLRGWRVHTSATISRHAPEGPAVLRHYGSHLARVVFVNLGTNDDPRAISSFDHSIRRVMHIAGPRRCVVWSTIVRPPVAGKSYHEMNATIAAEARRRHNMIMFRWGQLARANRGWFGPDHVHPSATGYKVRARAMAKKVKGCRKLVLHHKKKHRH